MINDESIDCELGKLLQESHQDFANSISAAQ